MARSRKKRRRKTRYEKQRGLQRAQARGSFRESESEFPVNKVANPESFQCYGEIKKVDEDLGLVFGYLMICKTRDPDTGSLQEYVDLHGNAITEQGMLSALTDFMLNSRTTKAMHRGGPRGEAVFAFPMTEEIAKAYGFENPPITGALFAARPDPESLAKFASGEYTGFSIGGAHLEPPEPIQ